jgi:hypothetical protein
MTTPGVQNTSQTARLMVGAPGFAVGWQEPLYLPSPAVGAQWSHKCDGRYYERLLAVSFTLTASAAVPQRFPVLNLTDTNGVVITEVPAGAGVAASTSLVAYLATGVPGIANASAGAAYGYLPDLLIPPGWAWSSQVFGMDVADQLSGIVMLVQRFPNDAASISANG